MADDTPPFRIGLVLAGAVSAGAYSAGVLDFIIEALDAYEVARTTGSTPEGEPWTGPTHAVRVPVLSGASAGGMTAAMAAKQLFADFESAGPGRPSPPPERNRLYASWVDEIDIAPLLATTDLDNGQPLRSVLCSDILDTILGRTIALKPTVVRPWVGEGDRHDLALLMTVSNVEGIPYAFDVTTGGAHGTYAMLNHGDDQRFLVGVTPVQGARHSGFDILDLRRPDPNVEKRFGWAALATGAFPIGLAARPQTKAFDDYRFGDRVVVDVIDDTGALGYKTIPPVPPPPQNPPQPDRRHGFTAVDGGVIDNEPIELARRFLSGSPQPNPMNRDGRKTTYAVVLIDPFPNQDGWPKEDTSPAKTRLWSVAPKLLSMLIDQARFKPQELALAMDESVFSRFAILPESVSKTRAAVKLPIASGTLGGFSGFLHRSFRHHDYCLGRRNAQAFLRWHFHLPETNPLFDAWKNGSANVAQWYVDEPPPDDKLAATPRRKAQVSQVVIPQPPPQGDALTAPNTPEQVFALPIIPLTPKLQAEIKLGLIDMPKPDSPDLTALEDALRTRMKKVIGRLVDDHLGKDMPGGWFGGLGSLALKLVLPGLLTKKAMGQINAALREIKAAFPERVR